LRPTALHRHLGFASAVAATPGAKSTALDSTGGAEEIMQQAARIRMAQVADWTGIFCTHDLAAIRLIHALESVGFRVPQDISVVGFDELPAAAMMSPRLSTVRVNCQAFGEPAIALILRRLAKPDCAPTQLECSVVPVSGGTIAQFAQRCNNCGLMLPTCDCGAMAFQDPPSGKDARMAKPGTTPWAMTAASWPSRSGPTWRLTFFLQTECGNSRSCVTPAMPRHWKTSKMPGPARSCLLWTSW